MNIFKSLFGRSPARPPAEPAFNPNPLNQPTVRLHYPRPSQWIACQDAQPQPDVPVLILFSEEGRQTIGLGVRTVEISAESKQEKWRCAFLTPPNRSGGITHWRPI